jgi:hypothetical protein
MYWSSVSPSANNKDYGSAMCDLKKHRPPTLANLSVTRCRRNMLKKLLAITFFILMMAVVQPAEAKCIAGQQRVDPVTTLVYVDLDCNGFVDVVEVWKWNGYQWILAFVRPY